MSNRNYNRAKLYDFDEFENALDRINSSKRHAKPEFKPEYLAGLSYEEKAINAMIEIRALWKYVEAEAYYNYSNMYSKLSFPISATLYDECRKHKEHFAVYDPRTRKWLVEKNEPSYEYCYNGENFENFENAKSSRERLLLVGKYTILMQESNLLKKTERAPDRYNYFKLCPDLKLIVGVPGCGKTTYLVNDHECGSLVLTSCKEGAVDIRRRILAKAMYDFDTDIYDMSTPTSLFESYRTIDSYLLHQGSLVRKGKACFMWEGKYSTVWVDEALMEHPGKLFLVCLFSQCRTMRLLGDPNQLGFINRVRGINLLYDKSSMFYTASETLNISHRCPVDVMAILSGKYEGGAYSTSETITSMECKEFTQLNYVPKSDKFKYLVFKQAEKKKMIQAGYDVSTIHEFQGKEADHVIIVRMSRNPKEELYKSQPHILVGISRHKESLVYYTPVEDDMKKLIETPLTVAKLKKVRKTTDEARTTTIA